MKRLVLIISAILSLVALQAQVSDGYLTNEDYVTISVLVDENGDKRRLNAGGRMQQIFG